MRRDSLILTLALLLFAAVAPARAQGAAASAEALEALSRFLATDCEVGEPGSALAALLQHGRELEPELERLLRDGPDTTLLDEVTDGLALHWDERSAFLETHPQLGLDPVAWLDVVSTTREAWIERGVLRFTLVCREKAAVALVAIGSPRALGVVRDALDEAGVRDVILTLLEQERWLDRERPRRRDDRRAPTGHGRPAR